MAAPLKTQLQKCVQNGTAKTNADAVLYWCAEKSACAFKRHFAGEYFCSLSPLYEEKYAGEAENSNQQE